MVQQLKRSPCCWLASPSYPHTHVHTPTHLDSAEILSACSVDDNISSHSNGSGFENDKEIFSSNVCITDLEHTSTNTHTHTHTGTREGEQEVICTKWWSTKKRWRHMLPTVTYHNCSFAGNALLHRRTASHINRHHVVTARLGGMDDNTPNNADTETLSVYLTHTHTHTLSLSLSPSFSSTSLTTSPLNRYCPLSSLTASSRYNSHELSPTPTVCEK